uniref:MYND-type domain-containing protein n=1 Tax=Schistocephalus solidus TaxID=70667 RepID=A0A0X3PZ80_SCHSO
MFAVPTTKLANVIYSSVCHQSYAGGKECWSELNDYFFMSQLHYGFAEPAPACTLVSHLFPDKIGGRPAWLALDHLPDEAQLVCCSCSQPMAFLLQLYSPLGDDREDCFHRMLFVFMCKSGRCFFNSASSSESFAPSSVPFRVFRSQMAKSNPYYSLTPPDEKQFTPEEMLDAFRSGALPAPNRLTPLCPICGCRGTKICANCKKASYCSRSHQLLHWKLCHKRHCPNYDYLDEMFSTNPFLLPEFALVSEAAAESDIVNSHTQSDDDSSDTEAPAQTLTSVDSAEFAALETISRKETKEELIFSQFRQVMKVEPDQVIRFQRGGEPFWVSTTQRTIPSCEVCGGKRIFEFQITPQILSHLKLDCVKEPSPDFATVYVFTCENSCSLPRTVQAADGRTRTIEYQEEFVAYDPVP